jgi:hypothetical protein
MKSARIKLFWLIAFAIVQTLGAEELTRQGQRITWHAPSPENSAKSRFVGSQVSPFCSVSLGNQGGHYGTTEHALRGPSLSHSQAR